MSCPLCQAENCPTRFSQTDRLFKTTDKVFDVKECGRCDVLFLSPVPTPDVLPTYYPDGYWLGPPEDEDAVEAKVEAIQSEQDRHHVQRPGPWNRLLEFYRRLALRDHVKFVRRVLAEQEARGGDSFLLDVGCGDGSFLAACGAKKSMGMDLSHGAARHTKARGFDVVRGGLDAVPLRDGTFSLISMFHVLEHVYDPHETLRTVHRMLRAGGDLVIQVPNVASWQAKLFGRNWHGLEVPRHLFDFTPKSLRAVLTKAGFEPVRETHFSIRDNPTTFSNSVVPGLFPPARAARGKSGALGDLVYLGVTLASIPFTLVESAFGQGASVMVHARRV